LTIHRVQNLTLPDLNRALELIQKQAKVQVQTAASTNQSPSGGGGVSFSGSSSAGTTGATGPVGPAGADGIANLDLIVSELTESEEIIMDESGNIVTDGLGLGVTDIHTDLEVVEDQYGAIITAE
jgi:hypothetical protein